MPSVQGWWVWTDVAFSIVNPRSAVTVTLPAQAAVIFLSLLCARFPHLGEPGEYVVPGDGDVKIWLPDPLENALVYEELLSETKRRYSDEKDDQTI